jgi:hypothetical protein
MPHMDINEEKIRKITAEAQRALGAHANADMIKKVVQAVVQRLLREGAKGQDS